MKTSKRSYWTLPHVFGLFVAVLAYLAIFAITGNSDILIAIAMGITGAFAAWAHFKFLSSSHKK